MVYGDSGDEEFMDGYPEHWLDDLRDDELIPGVLRSEHVNSDLMFGGGLGNMEIAPIEVLDSPQSMDDDNDRDVAINDSDRNVSAPETAINDSDRDIASPLRVLGNIALRYDDDVQLLAELAQR